MINDSFFRKIPINKVLVLFWIEGQLVKLDKYHQHLTYKKRRARSDFRTWIETILLHRLLDPSFVAMLQRRDVCMKGGRKVWLLFSA